MSAQDFTEIELKLRINKEDIPRFKRQKVIKQHLASKPRTRRLISIYYDTPDLQLVKAGLSLRVRRMSGGWFQSIKTAGSVIKGLHNRMEWEDLLHSGKPDFNKITDPALIEVFANPALQAALKPIFITDVKRTEWQLKLPEGQIELALDIGALVIEHQTKADICEIELELKSGNESQLFEFAKALQKNITLNPENISKAELGYRFYQQ